MSSKLNQKSDSIILLICVIIAASIGIFGADYYQATTYVLLPLVAQIIFLLLLIPLSILIFPFLLIFPNQHFQEINAARKGGHVAMVIYTFKFLKNFGAVILLAMVLVIGVAIIDMEISDSIGRFTLFRSLDDMGAVPLFGYIAFGLPLASYLFSALRSFIDYLKGRKVSYNFGSVNLIFSALLIFFLFLFSSNQFGFLLPFFAAIFFFVEIRRRHLHSSYWAAYKLVVIVVLLLSFISFFATWGLPRFDQGTEPHPSSLLYILNIVVFFLLFILLNKSEIFAKVFNARSTHISLRRYVFLYSIFFVTAFALSAIFMFTGKGMFTILALISLLAAEIDFTSYCQQQLKDSETAQPSESANN